MAGLCLADSHLGRHSYSYDQLLSDPLSLAIFQLSIRRHKLGGAVVYEAELRFNHGDVPHTLSIVEMPFVTRQSRLICAHDL